MTDHMITIPETLYEKAQRVASQSARPVEQIIQERLAYALDEPDLDLPADERAELQALAYLSDDTLWTIMQEQMQSAKQERLSALMDKNSLGTISEAEYKELEALVEDGQRLILRKAEAMNLLMDRGYKVRASDMNPSND